MPENSAKSPETSPGLDAEALVRENISWMLLLAERILRDRSLAEDIVQDAFVAAFRSYSSFQGRSSEKTWLHRITVNAALDRLRKTGRLAEHSIDDLLPEFDQFDCRIEAPWARLLTPQQIFESTELQEQVRHSINQLPDGYRIVLQLRDIEELTTNEVAQLLKISESNVKVRLHRARAALKKLLEPLLRGEVGN